jgi:hypothetical protein
MMTTNPIWNALRTIFELATHKPRPEGERPPIADKRTVTRAEAELRIFSQEVKRHGIYANVPEDSIEP